MGGRSFAILGLAVGCGLVAMYGASQLVGARDKPVEMREMLVAARDLRTEEILKPDMVKAIQKPVAEIPSGAISDLRLLEGRWVEIPMIAGDPIIEGKLAAKDAVPGLPGRIPAGMRAFSIEVSEESGVAGFILPGYHVDIIQELQDDSDPRPRRRRALIVLQNVLVLAAGQSATRGEDKTLNVRTVTLAVEPDQAETLVAARSRGPLALALRGLDDVEIIDRPEPVEEPPLVAIAPPIPDPVPVPDPAPRLPVAVRIPPRPSRRTLIFHGLERPLAIHHRPDAVPGSEFPATAAPAVASAPPGRPFATGVAQPHTATP